MYILVSAPANLLWEVLQLPLYTIWTAPLIERVFAVVHCTIGDVMIASSALLLALAATRASAWPRVGFLRVAVVAGLLGLGYTGFSEWLNVVIRASWAYSAQMPTLSIFGFEMGVSPLLQWVVVPAISFTIVRRSLAGSPDSAA